MSNRKPFQSSVRSHLDFNEQRFEQLFQLSQEGNEEAVADLWHEFAFDFEKQSLRSGTRTLEYFHGLHD